MRRRDNEHVYLPYVDAPEMVDLVMIERRYIFEMTGCTVSIRAKRTNPRARQMSVKGPHAQIFRAANLAQEIMGEKRRIDACMQYGFSNFK